VACAEIAALRSKDILSKPKEIIQTLKDFGFKTISNMSELKTTKNICYFNQYRTNVVNKYVHRKLIKKPTNVFTINGVDYWKGLELTCTKHHKAKGIRLYVNYTYVIESIGEKFFKIIDDVEEKNFTLDISLLSHFKLPYADTCHSVQGLSISEPMTIFDINTPYVDKYFIWTSLTRATDFNNVTIFIHNDDEVSQLVKCKTKQHFVFKVDGYKHQDKQAKREFKNEEFITAEWIKEQYSKLERKACSCCQAPYEIVLDPNNVVRTNITVDRIDSNIAHVQTNCQLLCGLCNSTKGNRY